MGLSLRPSTFVEGGGLLDDVDVTVASAQFVLFDYNGTLQQPVPALGLELKDETDQVHAQYWTCGDSKYFVPSDDGKTLVPVGDKEALISSTNCAKFLESLVNAGLPEDMLDGGDISVLTGMNMHVTQVAQPKRGGLIITGKGGQEKKNPTVLLCTKINSMPGETEPTKKVMGIGGAKAAAGTKPNAPASGKVAAAMTASPSSSPIDEELAGHVIGILAEKGGEITKAALLPAIMKAVPVESKKAMVSRVNEAAFLSQTNWGWTFDGNKLTLA